MDMTFRSWCTVRESSDIPTRRLRPVSVAHSQSTPVGTGPHGTSLVGNDKSAPEQVKLNFSAQHAVSQLGEMKKIVIQLVTAVDHSSLQHHVRETFRENATEAFNYLGRAHAILSNHLED